jgi:hypothetical protein
MYLAFLFATLIAGLIANRNLTYESSAQQIFAYVPAISPSFHPDIYK